MPLENFINSKNHLGGMDENPEKKGILYALLHRMKPHHHHINFLLIAIIILVIIIMLLVKPALLGFKISKQFEEIGVEASDFIRQADKIKGDLKIAETQLKSCEGLNKGYLQDTADEKDKTFACEQKNQELSFDLSRVETEFEQKKQIIQAELTSLINESGKPTMPKVTTNAGTTSKLAVAPVTFTVAKV